MREPISLSNQPFTIGFEVEVVVMSRSVQDAAKAIGRQGIVEAAMERDVFTFLKHMIQGLGKEASVYVPGPTHNVPDYKVWNITSDNSIEVTTTSMDDTPPKKRPIRVGVELISPKFCFTTSDWETDVITVFTSLNQLHWKPNRSTGLHVHVGVKGREFTLAELKGIAKYVLIFEG